MEPNEVHETGTHASGFWRMQLTLQASAAQPADEGARQGPRAGCHARQTLIEC